MRTHRSKMRRARALWRHCKPTPYDVLGAVTIAAVVYGLMVLL